MSLQDLATTYFQATGSIRVWVSIGVLVLIALVIVVMIIIEQLKHKKLPLKLALVVFIIFIISIGSTGYFCAKDIVITQAKVIKEIPTAIEEEYGLDDVLFIKPLDTETFTNHAVLNFTGISEGKLRVYLLKIKDNEATVYTDNGEVLKPVSN